MTPALWTTAATILDVSVVYCLVYYLLKWLKGTQSFVLIRGLVVIGFLYVICQWLNLHTVNWLVSNLTSVLIIMLIVVFQNELRRLLERLGSSRFFSGDSTGTRNTTQVIKQLLRAVQLLSKKKIGALIVIEMTTTLYPYSQTGIPTDAVVSAELLVTLFWPNSPTHDGAVILKDNTIVAVDCLLPLSEAYLVDRSIGTRHRAALGLSEKTDALIIIVSEETGIISLAENGNLTRYLNRETLETRLFNLYSDGETAPVSRFKTWLSK